MSINSTDHIANNEVQYYYDEIFQKITVNIKAKYNLENYIFLGQEAMYLLIIMLDKYKIQFYSAMTLTYRCTQNPLHKYEYIDIASIQTIIRSCYETFLTFEYIFMQPDIISKFEKKELSKSKEGYFGSARLKILLYKYEGYRQSYFGFSTIKEEQEKSRKLYEEYKLEISNNNIFKSYNDESKNYILKNWRPSWNTIASRVELSDWNSKNMYNIISQYSHNSYTSLILLDHHYRHVDKYDRDSSLVQLFEFTAILINDYIRLFHLEDDILDKDEINLLNEFYTLAQKNPTDTNIYS